MAETDSKVHSGSETISAAPTTNPHGFNEPSSRPVDQPSSQPSSGPVDQPSSIHTDFENVQPEGPNGNDTGNIVNKNAPPELLINSKVEGVVSKVADTTQADATAEKQPPEEKKRRSKGQRVGNPYILNSAWVFLGVCGMLAGILIVHRYLLPRIYVCPAGATCRHYLDPNGNTIPHLQSLMQYCFQAGLWLSGIGLTKFISYSTRFVLKRQEECRIGSVETSFLALQGSWSDALLQLTLMQKAIALVRRSFQSLPKESPQLWVQKGTSWLGVLALLQFGIGLVVSIVISSSIPKLRGTINVHVPFKYHDAFTLPHADTRFSSSDELSTAYQLNTWLSSPAGSLHPSTVFDGTLVLRDNRTTQTTNPSPTGSRIIGDLVACGPQGWNVFPLATDAPYFSDGHAGNLTGVKAYNFSSEAFTTFSFVAYSYTYLASQYITPPELHGSVITRQYLWASNTSTTIPNATASHDGGMYYAVCNHTAYMADLPPANGSDVQKMQPSQPIIYSNPDDPNVKPCPSNDPFVCVSWSVDRLVHTWWQLSVPQDLDLTPFSCLNGLLVAFDGVSDTSDCSLTGGRWAKTLSIVLDSYISFAPVSGSATQYLWASTEAFNADHWWIQVVLPGSVFILYLFCIAYTWYLNDGSTEELKEIDLPGNLCGKVTNPNQHDIRYTILAIE